MSTAASAEIRPSVGGRLWRAIAPTLPVWGFSAFLGLLALGLWVLVVRDLEPLGTPYIVPWMVLALAHALAETTAVHVQWFRRDTHTFSLSEIPIVVGMFVLTPGALIAAVAVGSCIALITRRQSPMKLTFNLAQFALGVTAASAVFYSVTSASNALSPLGIVAAFLAIAVNGAVSVLCIATVISLSERTVRYSNVPALLRFNLGANVINTSIGILTVIMLWRSPTTTWVLIIPSGLVVLAYRNYTRMRKEQEGIELLYETGQLLYSAPALGGAVVGLLEQARHVFNADVAQLILLNERGDALSSRLGPDDFQQALVPTKVDLTEAPWAAIVERPGVHVQIPSEPGRPLAGAIEGVDVDDGMAVALRGEEDIVGVLTVVNRLDVTTSFDATHRRLLEALATQITSVWERVVSSSRCRSSSRSNSSSPIRPTTIRSPVWPTGRCSPRRSRRRCGRRSRAARLLAVMFIDLDDFKQVNDRLGHAAGDQLLITIADRIRSCVRPSDIVGADRW